MPLAEFRDPLDYQVVLRLYGCIMCSINRLTRQIAAIVLLSLPACSNNSSHEVSKGTTSVEEQTKVALKDPNLRRLDEPTETPEEQVVTEILSPSVAQDDLLPDLNTPGEGPPPRGALAKTAIVNVGGQWSTIAKFDGVAVTFSLDPASGPAAGIVTNLEGWPSEAKVPTRWIFLAMGQLVLTSEDGVIVWGGKVKDENTIQQTRSSEVELIAITRQK